MLHLNIVHAAPNVALNEQYRYIDSVCTYQSTQTNVSPLHKDMVKHPYKIHAWGAFSVKSPIDNDPEHTARNTKKLLALHRPKTLDWPSNSPDLNPKGRVKKQVNKVLINKKAVVREII
ncbi:14060_t:CDS:2 [Entrophospora sp. SA101]|nr:14060_t:CDS:2 [Entrophospora sp. SA101]